MTGELQATTLPAQEVQWAALVAACPAFLGIASIPRQPYGLTRSRLATPLAAWGALLHEAGAYLPTPEGFDPWGAAAQPPEAAAPSPTPPPAPAPRTPPNRSPGRAQASARAGRAAARAAEAVQQHQGPQSAEEKAALEAHEAAVARARAGARAQQEGELAMQGVAAYLDHVSDVLGQASPTQLAALAQSHAEALFRWLNTSGGVGGWVRVRQVIDQMRDAVRARLAELASMSGEAALRIRQYLATCLEQLNAAAQQALATAERVFYGGAAAAGAGGAAVWLLALFALWIFLKRR